MHADRRMPSTAFLSSISKHVVCDSWSHPRDLAFSATRSAYENRSATRRSHSVQSCRCLNPFVRHNLHALSIGTSTLAQKSMPDPFDMKVSGSLSAGIGVAHVPLSAGQRTMKPHCSSDNKTSLSLNRLRTQLMHDPDLFCAEHGIVMSLNIRVYMSSQLDQSADRSWPCSSPV